MNFNTIEGQFEYQVKQIIEQYRKDMESDATGEDLEAEMWENKEIVGEIFLNRLFEYMDISELDEE